MPDQNQEQKAEPEKQKVGFFSEWLEFARNRIKRLPGIERLRLGRRQVGERRHDIEEELRTTWLDLNDRWFESKLKTIEQYWKETMIFYGEGTGDDTTLLGNPDGIVRLYADPETGFGVYSDVERINSEVVWFELSTGYAEEYIKYEIPKDPKEWDKYQWTNKNVIEENIKDPRRIEKLKLLKRIKLSPGIIYHEGKKDLREELYCFGHHQAKRLGEVINDYDKELNIQALQQKGVEVEVRTKLTNTVKALQELFGEIAKVEKETFDHLNKLKKKADEIWLSKWNELVGRNSPESKDVAVIRFEHTYRIIKLARIQEIEEKIAIKGRVMKDKIGNVLTHYVNKRRVVTKLKQDKNIYEEEEEEIDEKLKELQKLYDAELGDIEKKIRSVDKLSDVNTFNRIVNDIIRKKRNNLKDIIESSKDVNTKIGLIIELIAHDDIAISELLHEILKDSELALREILQSEESTNIKIDKIAIILMSSLRASVIIENLLINIYDVLKGAFEPKDKEGKEKSAEDIFNLLLQALLTTYSVIDNIIKAIFNKRKEDILALASMPTAKEEEIDTKAKVLINDIIKPELKNFDRNDAKILTKLEELKAFMNGKKAQYESKILSLKERLTDIKNITNKEDILEILEPKIDKNDFWQRPEEKFDYGLDENGYPLEIDPKTGEVLIDRWWSEISDNPWQLERIALKCGGADVLKTHLGVDVVYYEEKKNGKKELRARINGTPSRPIRKITDEKFWGYVDLLELGAIIYSYWDSVRDDLRDGRFHPWSKTVADYVIEGMGGFDENRGAPYLKAWAELWRSKGWFVTRRGIVPLGSTGINVNVKDPEVLKKAKPEDFENVPDEEKAITQNYKMKMPNGKFIEGIRRPTKYNPAFDRRSETMDYVHWGRMYYYEWIGALNRWSENPFPHISTRGIALYIAYLAATDVYSYSEAEKAIEGHPFDYGVRGMGKFGIVNPLSGTGILQEN